MTTARFLTLHAVAQCFAVEVRWLEQACELGLLRGRVVQHTVTIAVDQLDRVATILRLHHHGVNLPGIALLLGVERRSDDAPE